MALKRQEPWAIRMIFANAFIPNNVLEYSVSNLGGYEQCLRTVAPTYDTSTALRGQYCTMTLRITKRYAKSLVKKFNAIGDLEGRFDLYALPDKIRGRDYAFLLGICGPSTCSQEDLMSLIHAGKQLPLAKLFRRLVSASIAQYEQYQTSSEETHST
ncbi:uncharacterized protein LOC119376326 [Rhipicephalus sanguineus]|uniref:uncharacterized protein LOC119376326 n=1 Tax=Rhipicephalus sanguineus TaxID=34632 RepID=UPI0020C51426|nr:uncharacterized protein LOC119376326 [Rhipicephalus sanguineus]